MSANLTVFPQLRQSLLVKVVVVTLVAALLAGALLAKEEAPASAHIPPNWAAAQYMCAVAIFIDGLSGNNCVYYVVASDRGSNFPRTSQAHAAAHLYVAIRSSTYSSALFWVYITFYTHWFDIAYKFYSIAAREAACLYAGDKLGWIPGLACDVSFEVF
jgi:hypothetical protein